MDKHKKQKNLKERGLLNPKPERITDPLFKEKSEFFDPSDLLQTRYEMVRSHQVDQASVVDICQRFGVSRQTFYTLLKKFLNEGSAGFLAKKVGPKSPSKLNADIMAYIESRFVMNRDVKARELMLEVQEQFETVFHKRTVEKVLQTLRKKKS